MKILGIHGRGSTIRSSKTWAPRIEDLKNRGYDIELPQFDSSEDPTYESWAKGLNTIDIEGYDVVFASSHGSGVFARYIKEKNLRLKRVIFCCPGRGGDDGKNTGAHCEYLETHDMNLENNIDEIYVIHSKDDEVVPFSEGKKFHSQIGGIFIPLKGFPHKLNGEATYIINDYVLGKKK